MLDAASDLSEPKPSVQEAWTPASSSSQEMASVTDERPRVDSIARMMEGPPANDEDYDTDLEEDFPPGKLKIFIYLFVCGMMILQYVCFKRLLWTSQTLVGGRGGVQILMQRRNLNLAK